MFAELGEEVFDDYWQNYLTSDMARKIESRAPFRNLREYLLWRGRPPVSVLNASLQPFSESEPTDTVSDEAAEWDEDAAPNEDKEQDR